MVGLTRSEYFKNPKPETRNLFFIGATPADQTLGGFLVPALQHHRPAARTDSQDSGRAFAPGGQALGAPTDGAQQPLPPGMPERYHNLQYNKNSNILQYSQDIKQFKARRRTAGLTKVHFPFEIFHNYMVCKKITYSENRRKRRMEITKEEATWRSKRKSRQ
jgi:hypothetical protein